MGFLTPWFLAGIAAISLPFWLHLLRQHRSTPLPFSSLMFFERRTQSSIKHRKLRYLILMALRMALLVMLAIAFAHPFLKSTSARVVGRRKVVMFVIDNSYSMRQGDRLDRAKRDAMAALSQVTAENRGEILALGSNVRIMSEQSSDPVVLRAGIQAVEPTDTRGSYVELVRALRSIAQAAKMPVEAHLFSDFQKSSLPANFGDLRLAEGITLIPHAVASGRVPNFAVENVLVPHRVYSSKKVRVQATVSGFGTEKAAKRVALILNGREIESKQVDIPAGGRGSVEFVSLEAPYGQNRGEVRVESGDAFADDDRFYFSVERSDARKALFVHDARNSRGLLYFRTALDTSSEAAFQLDAATVEQVGNISPTQYAFVVLSDTGTLPRGFEDALRTYVRGGGAVLVSLGPVSAHDRKAPIFDEEIQQARYSSREGDRFQTVAYLDPAHPSIRKADRWDDVKFYQSVQVAPGKARVVGKLSDGTPLILEKQIGEGRVMLFASTFDNLSNDLPLHPAFVPFIEQTSAYLGRLDSAPANYAVGSYLELRSAREANQSATVEVLGPKGERALSLEEATKAQNVQLTSVGYYDVRRPSGRHELVAVNADRHESDLEIIPADTLALWQNTSQVGGEAANADGTPERKQFSLWWYVMLLALAVALAETLVGNRHLGIEKEPKEKEAKKEAAA